MASVMDRAAVISNEHIAIAVTMIKTFFCHHSIRGNSSSSRSIITITAPISSPNNISNAIGPAKVFTTTAIVTLMTSSTINNATAAPNNPVVIVDQWTMMTALAIAHATSTKPAVLLPIPAIVIGPSLWLPSAVGIFC